MHSIFLHIYLVVLWYWREFSVLLQLLHSCTHFLYRASFHGGGRGGLASLPPTTATLLPLTLPPAPQLTECPLHLPAPLPPLPPFPPAPSTSQPPCPLYLPAPLPPLPPCLPAPLLPDPAPASVPAFLPPALMAPASAPSSHSPAPASCPNGRCRSPAGP